MFSVNRLINRTHICVRRKSFIILLLCVCTHVQNLASRSFKSDIVQSRKCELRFQRTMYRCNATTRHYRALSFEPFRSQRANVDFIRNHLRIKFKDITVQNFCLVIKFTSILTINEKAFFVECEFC